jgi:hypothetical protein
MKFFKEWRMNPLRPVTTAAEKNSTWCRQEARVVAEKIQFIEALIPYFSIIDS